MLKMAVAFGDVIEIGEGIRIIIRDRAARRGGWSGGVHIVFDTDEDIRRIPAHAEKAIAPRRPKRPAPGLTRPSVARGLDREPPRRSRPVATKGDSR